MLDGTVRVAISPTGARQVRITPELIRVADGSRIWGEPYGGVLAEVFRLQSDVAARVTKALEGPVVAEQRSLLGTPTEDLEAYRLYMLGRAEWSRRETENLELAAEYFRQVIARDSGFARAWAGLADTYAIFAADGVTSLPSHMAYERVRAVALQAIALDSSLVEARIAVQLDPLVPSTNNVLGHAYWWTGQVDDAVAVYRVALARDPSSELLSYNLLQVYLTSARTTEALALLTAERDTSTFLRAMARAPHDPRVRAAALDALGRFKARRSADWTHWSLARHYAMLGERAAALEELELAAAVRDPNLEAIKVALIASWQFRRAGVRRAHPPPIGTPYRRWTARPRRC